MVGKYQKDYVVKSYEVDCHGFLRLLSLMNFLQEAAVESAELLGFGFAKCAELGVAWVGAGYRLEIAKFPKMHEKFTVETWPSEAKLWGAVRDFVVKDSSGAAIIKASSLWVLVDAVAHRPVALKKYFPNYCAINEREIKTDFPKIEMPTGAKSITDFRVRFDDIDVNRHVNNAVYPVWASECVAGEYRLHHCPREIEICFLKEALFGETVCVETTVKTDESFHLLCNADTKSELVRCRIKWQQVEK